MSGLDQCLWLISWGLTVDIRRWRISHSRQIDIYFKWRAKTIQCERDQRPTACFGVCLSYTQVLHVCEYEIESSAGRCVVTGLVERKAVGGVNVHQQSNSSGVWRSSVGANTSTAVQGQPCCWSVQFCTPDWIFGAFSQWSAAAVTFY